MENWKQENQSKHSANDLKLPGYVEIKPSAIDERDCFFDSIRQGLKQLHHNEDYTVKSLRQVCKKRAMGNQQLKEQVIRDARSVDSVILPAPDVSDDELWNVYLARIEYTSEDMRKIKVESPNLYNSLTDLRYGSVLHAPIWGRTNIEGKIICQEYHVKLHITAKHEEAWTTNVIDESGTSHISSDVSYNGANTIYIINQGDYHFKPILIDRNAQFQHYIDLLNVLLVSPSLKGMENHVSDMIAFFTKDDRGISSKNLEKYRQIQHQAKDFLDNIIRKCRDNSDFMWEVRSRIRGANGLIDGSVGSGHLQLPRNEEIFREKIMLNLDEILTIPEVRSSVEKFWGKVQPQLQDQVQRERVCNSLDLI